jgi:alkaline phosphatase D
MPPSAPEPPADRSLEIDRRKFLLGIVPTTIAAVAAIDSASAGAAEIPVELAPLPPADHPLSRIAFGACHKLDRPFGVWDVIRAGEPELFIFLGDTVYLDTVDMRAKAAEYAKFAAVPEFAKFRRQVPIVSTWDDHDYGENDGGASYPKRDESQQIFLDFFREPADSPRRTRAGVYTSHVAGPLGRRTQIILLDTRYFRSPLRPDFGGGYLPQRDRNATMLGDDQWRWFADQLRVPAEVRLIVSSIQVQHEDQPNEKWANIPAERDKLFKTIADSKAAGVIFISGDRHHGEISSMDIGAGYRVADITSSGLNCAYAPNDEPNRHREGRILWADNFGGVRINWDLPDPTINLQIHASDDGSVAVHKQIKLSQLQPPK